MKLLRRNTTEFEYLAYTGLETDVNADGEHTGDFRPELASPVICRGNISAPGGNAVQTFYGVDARYTHVLVMDRPDFPMDVTGRIRWRGNEYEILAVRPSLNVLNAALRKVTDNHGTVPEPAGD